MQFQAAAVALQAGTGKNADEVDSSDPLTASLTALSGLFKDIEPEPVWANRHRMLH
jgi:hypothetical protein